MKPKRRAWTSFTVLRDGVVAALFVAGACANPPPDNSPDPCAVLGTECDSCTSPGPKQTCQTAVASADVVQCTVALDDPAVISACSASDGGVDGSAGDASADAELPACGSSLATADAGCACSETCTPPCLAGGCDVVCLAGALCSPTCEGGKCTVHCKQGSTCEGSCAAGGCVFECEGGSTCANSCAGGGCAFQCEDDAVCTDTCTGGGCVGM